MEQISNEAVANTNAPGGCINCGHPVVVPGYPNALCADCRQRFIKFPIPNWIKIFGAAIGLIFLFSLYKIPRNISLGIHFEKGKTAITEKKYLTAQRELEIFLKKVPRNLEARCYLLIASFYNEDYETSGKMFEQLKDQNIEDKDLVSQVEQTLQFGQPYFANEKFSALLKEYDNDVMKIPRQRVKNYLDSNKDDIYAATTYVQITGIEDKQVNSDSILTAILKLNPDYTPALFLASAQNRLNKKFEASIENCDRMLNINKESPAAFASKARTLLWMKKDKEALENATAAVDLDPHHPYMEATLLMAYHFNQKQKEEEELRKKMAANKDSIAIETYKYAFDVISGKEPFRN